MKKKLLLIFLTFLIIANNCYAQDVIILDKDKPAPFHGYLFPDDKALKFKQDLVELDALRAMEASYEKSINLYKKNEELFDYKVNVLLEQNDKLADALYKQKDRNTWENFGWYFLGVVSIGLGAYAGLRAVR